MATRQCARTTETSELWSMLMQTAEDNFDPMLLTQYLEAIQDEPSQQFPIDVEALLAAFKHRHQLFMENLSTEPLCDVPSPEEKKKLHLKRLKHYGKAIMIGAAVFGCMTIMAYGKDQTLVAEWGAEVLRLSGAESSHKTYRESEDGSMLYFGDGHADDRHGQITREEADLYLAGKLTKEEIQTRHADEHAKMEEESQKLQENGELLPITVLGKQFNVDLPIQEAAAQYGVTQKLFPTWVPEGLERVYTSVSLDENGEPIGFDTFYEQKDTDKTAYFGCGEYHSEGTCIIEKDSRSVETYTKGGIEFYLVHNLDSVTAYAISGSKTIDIGGRGLSIEELKKMIDSIFET